MKVLVVGSGGREHALAWALGRSSRLTELHAAPGSPGMATLAFCHPVRADDPASLVPLAVELRVDLVVVGPETPLVAGLADDLRRRGVAVFGPGAGAAQIEGSKSFAKAVMAAAGVPTARMLAVARPPCVVKADGLAAGKGVWVCRTQAELDAGLRAAEALGQPFHVEELLEGEEVSIFALCDGHSALPLPAAQDYKRIGEGDEGPNTGGMGSYSPVPRLTGAEVAELVETVHRPVLAALERRGAPFVGALFAGLMLTADGPRVLEFNCRFGDPETQAIMPLFDSDLAEIMIACTETRLDQVEVCWYSGACATVVLASEGYPGKYPKGLPISGLESESEQVMVFHAGTAVQDDQIVTAGGRVLSVSAYDDALDVALLRA